MIQIIQMHHVQNSSRLRYLRASLEKPTQICHTKSPIQEDMDISIQACVQEFRVHCGECLHQQWWCLLQINPWFSRLDLELTAVSNSDAIAIATSFIQGRRHCQRK